VVRITLHHSVYIYNNSMIWDWLCTAVIVASSSSSSSAISVPLLSKGSETTTSVKLSPDIATMSSFHLVLGRPLFLFPIGFHFNRSLAQLFAALVARPAHFHFHSCHNLYIIQTQMYNWLCTLCTHKTNLHLKSSLSYLKVFQCNCSSERHGAAPGCQSWVYEVSLLLWFLGEDRLDSCSLLK